MPNADDRWLLPRRQTEVPTWDMLSETTVHGRREGTYLVLAAMFLVSLTALLALGVSRVIEPAAVLHSLLPGVELPVAALLPIGAIPFALCIAALTLVCELFGRRRTTALVWVGFFASLGVVGMMRLGDLTDGGDASGVALALAACATVTNVGYVMIFDALRRRTRGYWLWPRLFGSALLPIGLGWCAFALALATYGERLGAAPARETITALAVGAGAWTLLCLIVLSVPILIAVRACALFLRVGRIRAHDAYDDEDDDEAPATSGPAMPAFATRASAQPPPPPPARTTLAQGSVAQDRPKAPAVLVEDDGAGEPRPAPRRSQRNLLVDTSAELRFFTEGDQLEAAD